MYKKSVESFGKGIFYRTSKFKNSKKSFFRIYKSSVKALSVKNYSFSMPTYKQNKEKMLCLFFDQNKLAAMGFPNIDNTLKF